MAKGQLVVANCDRDLAEVPPLLQKAQCVRDFSQLEALVDDGLDAVGLHAAAHLLEVEAIADVDRPHVRTESDAALGPARQEADQTDVAARTQRPKRFG